MKQLGKALSEDGPAMAARNRFGRYKDESLKPVRDNELAEKEAITQLRAAWKRLVERSNRVVCNYESVIYEDIAEHVKGLDYSPEDVKSFSVILAEYHDFSRHYSLPGMFLSALINEGKDSDYVLQLNSMPEGLSCVCCKNRKNVTVLGDAGPLFALMMESGHVVLKGSCGYGAGYEMKKGRIEVFGNAGDNTSYSMMGGELVVHGNTGERLGETMIGGTIRIYGTFKSLGRNIDGTIYHGDKLIYEWGSS